jgi:hypothetical protein
MKRIALTNIKKFSQGEFYQGACHLDNNFKALHGQFKRIYQRQGESNRCVNDLNTCATRYHTMFKQSLRYKSALKKLVSEIKNTNNYATLSLIKNDFIKVTLHIMPKGFEIPPHAHPNQFSLVIVESGILEVEQFSWGAPITQGGSVQSLKQGENCIGLPVKDNLHYLKAASDCVIFLSIRMRSVEEQELNPPTLFSIITKKLMPSALCLLLPVVGSLTAHAGETYELYSGYKGVGFKNTGVQSSAFSKKVYSKTMTRNQARQFRQSSHYDSQVEAVNWYLKSARRGNAESQYWLGVMHLDGSGTTEDDEEAFKWISLSADQRYKPAVKLLDHLITSEFDLEC